MLRSATLTALLVAVLSLGAPAASAASADAELWIESVDDTPRPFRLTAAHPNPFSDRTRLELALDRTTSLTVAVYDALGREVLRLHEGTLQAGTYRLTIDGSQLQNGLYLVRAIDGRGVTATRSVALSR